MSIYASTFACARYPRFAPLTISLAVALGLTLSDAHAGDRANALSSSASRLAAAADRPQYLGEDAAMQLAALLRSPTKPEGPSRYVMTCDDDAAMPGTLRYEVANAANGATIDLSTLACSTITLGSEIVVFQDNLTLQGPQNSTLTIDGNSQSRIFSHTGSGVLRINELTLANGTYVGSNAADGGCIRSASDVVLTSSVISHCTVKNTGSGLARGAGIYSHGKLGLYSSVISNSDAYSVGGAAGGGGAYVGGMQAKYSTISNNTAYDGDINARSTGGGVFAFGNSVIQGSTISGNRAEYVGGLVFLGNLSGHVTITNSTVSTNIGLRLQGGIRTNSPLTLANSTVAFNVSREYSAGIGLFSDGAVVNIQSSIIAGNMGQGMASDFDISGAAATFNASIITSGSAFGGAIQDCPHLQPLADNGGPTRTHALGHASPAIDSGDAGTLTTDQRLAPRVAGAQADIGSVEWQPGETDERVFVGGFDGLCDQ